MEQKFLLLGLSERKSLSDASLGSSGINTESSWYVMGIHIETFSNYMDALEKAKTICHQFEYGCEIKRTYTP
jgi:hypothetical protein